jgi:glucokinase
MYVGIDIGGTNTRIGLFPSLATPDFTLLTRFPTHQDYSQQLQVITSALHNGLANHSISSISSISGIGVSIGGRLAMDGRSVAVAPNLPEYVGRPFAQDLETLWHCSVRLAHDTVCGLLAEKKFGVIVPYERCAYITLSTGTGGAIQLGKGSHALALSIEFGHQLLDGNTLQCLCGQEGCLETFTGGRQLELRLGHSVDQLGSDPTFWESFIAKLTLGLVNLAQLTRVEAIAVSGAIALQNDFLLPSIRNQLKLRLQNMELVLFPARLGEDAPLVGAVTLLEVPDAMIVY